MGVYVTPVYTLKCWWRLSGCENRWCNKHKCTTMQSEMQAFEQGFFLAQKTSVWMSFESEWHFCIVFIYGFFLTCPCRLTVTCICEWHCFVEMFLSPCRDSHSSATWGPNITGLQYWLLAFPLHTDISPDSQDILIMLCTADDQIYIILTILL